MTERKAVYYGQVELIPGIVCDGYVLDDDTAVMSERGTANLLGVDHMLLSRITKNWPPKTLKPFVDKGSSVETNLPPKTLKPFVDKGSSVETNLPPKTFKPFIDKGYNVRGNFVEVVARNSPHCHREIVVYTTQTIKSLIHTYALAFINDGLRKNQVHIGKRAVALSISLVQTALEIAIKQACGLSSDIQQTAQKNYIDAVKLIKEFGFTCSAPNDIAIKKDITQFLEVPESTLNSFLRKHKDDIEPIKLDRATIRSIGLKAPRMNGYLMDDVTKIALGMDSVKGIELKKKVFGQVGSFVKPETSLEIQWREVLSKVFKGFDLRFNYPIGPYKVDFFVAKLMLVLECNGYCHRYYNDKQEKAREKLIMQRYSLVRFHHKVSIETLFNGILQAKPGIVIQLYDLEQLGQEMPFNIKLLRKSHQITSRFGNSSTSSSRGRL